MSIKVGDTIRYAVTDEEGEVVAISDNTPCVAVRFGDSFTYLIAAKELELVTLRLGFSSVGATSEYSFYEAPAIRLGRTMNIFN